MSMRKLILLVAVLAITGCDKFIAPTGVNSAEALTRYVDKENGAICYQNDIKTLSCVKISGGERG